MKRKAGMLALALVLALTMSLTGMAESGETLTGETKEASVDVQAQYVSGVTTPEIYSVDVSWGAMEFTYQETVTKTWNPQNHSYDESVTGSEWQAAGNTVTVVNHSNVSVETAVSFERLEAYPGISGFFDANGDTLEAGVEGRYDDADSFTAKLTLAGTLDQDVSEMTKVGSITVTISVPEAE